MDGGGGRQTAPSPHPHPPALQPPARPAATRRSAPHDDAPVALRMESSNLAFSCSCFPAPDGSTASTQSCETPKSSSFTVGSVRRPSRPRRDDAECRNEPPAVGVVWPPLTGELRPTGEADEPRDERSPTDSADDSATGAGSAGGTMVLRKPDEDPGTVTGDGGEGGADGSAGGAGAGGDADGGGRGDGADGGAAGTAASAAAAATSASAGVAVDVAGVAVDLAGATAVGAIAPTAGLAMAGVAGVAGVAALAALAALAAAAERGEGGGWLEVTFTLSRAALPRKMACTRVAALTDAVSSPRGVRVVESVEPTEPTKLTTTSAAATPPSVSASNPPDTNLATPGTSGRKLGLVSYTMFSWARRWAAGA